MPIAGAVPAPDSLKNAAMDLDATQIDVEQDALDRLSNHIIQPAAGHKMQSLVAGLLEDEGLTRKVPSERRTRASMPLAGPDCSAWKSRDWRYR